jgi:hypothetical protein
MEGAMSAKSPNRFQSLTCAAVAVLALLGGPAVGAADDPKPSAPAAKSKWILPKYYDELELTDDQKARVTRVAETLNPKINKSKALLQTYNRNPLAYGIAAAQMSQLLRKLVHERQKQLDEILTEDQRKKLRELSGDSKSVPKPAASDGPKKPLEADNKGPEPTGSPTGRAADESKPLATAKHPLGATVEVLEVSIDDTHGKLMVVWR